MDSEGYAYQAEDDARERNRELALEFDLFGCRTLPIGAFAGDDAVSLARCRKHPDGLEVDGIFTPERHRGHGYANAAVWGLIEACGHDPLYMHSVLNLTGFYGHYGFVPIGEEELPTTIRERFAWAQGEMEGANVAPMMRNPTGP